MYLRNQKQHRIMIKKYTEESIALLKQMIAIPSVSRSENDVADMIQNWMFERGLQVERLGNNLIIRQKYYCAEKPVILLNSHIDTVKPASGYTRDPFKPEVEDGKLWGLGSNDAGAPMVSLLAAFRYLTQHTEQNYNLIYVASCEEEVSGKNGIESVVQHLGRVDLAIVGEPTQMQMAVAEKGLMVLDCVAYGKSGHAARNEGVNAIYEALPSINWFQTHKFERVSQFLGSVKMSVTQIEAGTQHNVVPDRCHFVVDVRVNEKYGNNELLQEIKNSVSCEVKERSTRLNSSSIQLTHPIVKRGLSLGLKTFGSPTMSDQALMPFTSIKIGPGDSARSHTANEYIVLDEIYEGVELYIKLLNGLNI